MDRLKGLRVLIVDDDPDTLSLSELVLQREGAHTLTASGIREAIEAFRTGRPDVLLCDLNLGETSDGCDLIRSLQDVTGRTIPAIAVSGMPRDMAGPRALKSGFSAYIEKPTNPGDLTKAIQVATSRS